MKEMWLSYTSSGSDERKKSENVISSIQVSNCPFQSPDLILIRKISLLEIGYLRFFSTEWGGTFFEGATD